MAVSRGLGCPNCLAGLRTPAPFGALNMPSVALQTLDFCDCETADKLRAALAKRGEYDPQEGHEERVKEAKRRRLMYLFGDAGVPRQFQDWTFKGWIAVAGADPGREKLRAAVLSHFNDRCIPDENAPDGFYSGIFTYGPSDLGKTGALVPLFKHYLEQGYTGLWVRYRDAMNMLKDFTDGAVVRERLAKLKEVPMLFLDELGDPGDKPSKYEREVIFEIISERRSQYLPTFITSNLQPGELSEHFGERVLKRIFELCAACPVDGAPMGALKGIEF